MKHENYNELDNFIHSVKVDIPTGLKTSLRAIPEITDESEKSYLISQVTQIVVALFFLVVLSVQFYFPVYSTIIEFAPKLTLTLTATDFLWYLSGVSGSLMIGSLIWIYHSQFKNYSSIL